MTLVVAYASESNIIAVADSRISRGSTTTTDAGAKLFMIPLRVKSRCDSLNSSQISHTVGLAFAGSTLIATNCHSIASTLTQDLWADQDPILPSLAEIAKLYASVSEYISIDHNSRLQKNDIQTVQMFVFGYCKSVKALQVYHIYPSFEGGGFCMEVDKIDPSLELPFAIGSGAQAFHKRSNQLNLDGVVSSPLQVFRDILETQLIGNVGGHIQMIEAGYDGAKINLVLDQSEDNPDQIALTFLGFDISKYGNVDGLSIGNSAMGFGGTERIAARAALRSRGIDPDGIPASRAVQNLASFESAALYARTMDRPVLIDTNYTLEPWHPELGERCLGAACKNCGSLVPLCRDTAWSQNSPIPFHGEGSISTICSGCGKKSTTKFEEIKMLAWSSK